MEWVTFGNGVTKFEDIAGVHREIWVSNSTVFLMWPLKTVNIVGIQNPANGTIPIISKLDLSATPMARANPN